MCCRPRWIAIWITLLLPLTASAELYECGEGTCYDMLGLDRYSFDAAAEKKAFRQMSLKWHPDKNGHRVEEATKIFRYIATAHETLSDPTIKAAYDYYLDHPEMTAYNKMNYYRAVYQPKTPVYIVLLGLMLCFNLIQIVHGKEARKTFLNSPVFKELLDAELLASCKGGRHGFQSGELSDQRKAQIRADFIERITEDPECPLHTARASRSLIPNILFWWPVGFVKYLKWRVDHRQELAEESGRIAREEKELKEQQEQEERENAEMEQKKAERRDEGAKRLAEKKKLEEEKKARWAEEARLEAEQKAAKEAERSLIVEGKVTSVDEMKKKGHLSVEVCYDDDGEEEAVQMVLVNKTLQVGERVKIALEGATLPKGGTVRRQKIAGEWSAAELLEVLGPEEASAEAECAPEAEDAAAADDADGQPRQRKKEKTRG